MAKLQNYLMENEISVYQDISKEGDSFTVVTGKNAYELHIDFSFSKLRKEYIPVGSQPDPNALSNQKYGKKVDIKTLVRVFGMDIQKAIKKLK